MSTNYEKLKAIGAEVVGGVVYHQRVAVGKFGEDGLVLTEAGQTLLNAAPKEDAPAEGKAAKPAAKAAKKAAAPEAPATPTAPLVDLEDI